MLNFRTALTPCFILCLHLACPYPLFAQTADGAAPLLEAVRTGDLPRVEALLRNGAKPAGLNEAADHNRLDIARVLLAAGADPNDGAPLAAAIDKGYPDMVDLLLKGGARPEHPSMPVYPLHVAARKGRTDLLRVLADRRTEINRRIEHYEYGMGVTPLMVAAREGHAEAVRFLLERGADTTIEDNDGLLTFNYALQGNNTDILSLVLERPPRLVPEFFSDGLFWAIEANADATAEMLLRRGANPKITRAVNGIPITTLMAAAARANPRMVKRLLDAGVDPNAKDHEGSTALFQVFGILNSPQTDEDIRACVALLLSHGASPRVVTSRGETLLMKAAQRRLPDVVERLVGTGLDVNAADLNGFTPLLWAFFEPAQTPEATQRRLETARILVRHGARLLAKDPSDYSALTRYQDDLPFVFESLRPDSLAYPSQPGSHSVVLPLLEHAACRAGEIYGETAARMCRAVNVLAFHQEGWLRVDPEVSLSLSADLYALIQLRTRKAPGLLEQVANDLELKAEDCSRTGQGPIKVFYAVNTQQGLQRVDGWTVYYKRLRDVTLERHGLKPVAPPAALSGPTSPAHDWLDASDYWMCAERTGSGYAAVVREDVQVNLQRSLLSLAVREVAEGAGSCRELFNGLVR